jgi:hypothetical protein
LLHSFRSCASPPTSTSHTARAPSLALPCARRHRSLPRALSPPSHSCTCRRPLPLVSTKVELKLGLFPPAAELQSWWWMAEFQARWWCWICRGGVGGGTAELQSQSWCWICCCLPEILPSGFGAGFACCRSCCFLPEMLLRQDAAAACR